MAIAKIDRNSKLGAAVELRRKKQNYVREEENTAKIDRNSAMGQYLVSTAADTVNSIMQSVKGNASLFENQQKSFSKFAQNNNRYIGDSEAAQKFSADFGKYADTLNKQAKQLRRIGMGEGNELYDTLTEQARYFSTNNMWLKNRMEYSSRFKDAKDENKNYYGWLNDNAVTDSVTAAERAKIYDENNARIAEIDEEMKTVGRQWNGTGGVPVYTGWGDKAKYKELKAEKEQLEAENRQYDRTQGKTDSNYKLTQNADFKQNSYAGENKNPSYEEMQQWRADFETARDSMNSEWFRQLEENKPVVDDKLALYDSARQKNETEDFFNTHGNESDTWGAYYSEGQNARWDLLTDEERGIYYYLRNTKGKEAGDEFLESMATVLGKRATDEIARNAHDMSGGELFLNNLVSVPATVLGNIGAFADTVSQLITGKEYNPYSVGNRIQAYAGTVRGETANRLDDATNNFSLLGQSAGDVYQALMSSVDSATGVFVLGSPLHLAQAGMGALTSTARELYDRGASGAEILGVSTAAGFFEMFFEKFSVDKFTDVILKKPTRTVADIIKKALIQGGTEASEEFCTELANMATEALILGDRQRVNDDISKYMQQGDSESAATAKAWAMNLYNAAVGGFISGGAMGGVSATAQYANHQLSEVPSMGQDVIDRNGVQELADSAYKIGNNAQNRDEKNRIDGVKTKRADRVLADAATEALKNQNARTVGRLADMVTARTEQAVEQMKKTQNAELVKDAGLKGIEAFAVKRALNSENGGRISQKIIKESDVFNKAEAARFEKAKQRVEERKAKIEQADRRIEADGAKINKAVRSGNAAKLVKNRSEGVRSDGLDVSLGAVTGVENGRISVEFDPDTHAVAAFDASGAETVTEDGSAAKTVKASSPEINALYEGINRAVTGTVDADSGTDVTGRTVNTGTKMSVNAANLALSMYNETANADASVYTRIMYETYKAGKRGLPFETLRESIAAEYDIGAYDGTVTGTQIKQMYKAGASEFEARPGVQRIGVKSVTTGEHKNALTQLSAIDLFAKKHGITIIAVDSLTDAEGNAINGEYRTGNNIVISLDADGGLYMPVVGHEIFHYAESINAEDAKALAEMIINTLKASKGKEWLEARRREYEGYGYKGEQIDSEIAADFFGAAVTQKEFERQIKTAELNKSFTQKIIDKVKEVVAELKEIMQKLRGQRLIYDAALDTDTETLEFFVDNLEKILNQAGTETKNTATEDGVKYQLKVGAAADVEKALKDKNYRDDVYLTESSPAVIANQNGVRNLPMLMKASHIRENVFTEDEARQRGLKVDKNINYHGLGKDLFLKIIDGLDDVQYAYRGTKNADNPSRRENYFLLISQYKDGDGNTINVPVFINEQGQYNRVFIETNKIATVFGRNDMLAYLQREVKKGNLVRIKNKSTQASERTTPIVAGYSLNASVDTTVTQKSPSVNSILSENPKKITKFQKKLPDVQEKLKKMSGSDDIDDVKRMAYGLADDFMKYAKAARLEMTETRGLMPQPTRISEIVAKYNDYRKTGVSNKQLESDITDIFTDYMNGVGSSGTLFNYITDTIMKRELNSYEVIGDETFKAVRAYTDGGRFKVSDATVGSLVDTFGSLGEINGILRENYGFTIAKETDTRAETRAVWAPVGAQLAEEAGYVFDGTDYTENAKGGFEYETLASLLQTAQNDPRIYRGWLTGANTPDERILAQDELADRVEEEALKMYGELMSAPARNTKADRYRKMLFDYSVKHAAQLDRLENRLAENKLRVEELKAENRAKMQELRGTKNEEIETVKQAYRERMKTQRVKRNETASKAKVRSQITKRVKVLNALLTRETDAKHIPQELKHTVAEFLLPFTEDSSVFGKAKDDVLSLERYVRMNDLLTDIYNATEGDSADGAALNERYRSLAGNLDGDLVRDFGEMRRTMAGKRLSQLSLDELQTVNKIVVNIANMVKQGRETFINGKKESLDEIGRETVSDLTSRRQRRKHLKPVDWAIDLMNDKETTPIYFFGEKLGGFFGQIYRDIRDAQDKWYVRCAEAQRSIEDLQDKYNFKKWSGKADKGVTFTLDDGGTVTLTREQILSIYATAKRERTGGNNTTHVFDGGIVVEDELRRGLKDKISTALAQRSEKGKKAFSDAFSEQIRSEARHLTVNDLARITAALTDEQKAYADSVVGLLSTTVGGWGNETSMEMYGYKKFTEDYYFPVMSDKSYLYTRFGISDDTRLKHAGFTNKVVRGANNPIIITDFTNVAAGHINQMALYSSFTVPIENMTRLYNYELSPTEDADGHTVRGMSVKKALTNAYGNAANEYIADFMRALNGGIKADSVENFLDWGTSKFKRAAVMANLSVIVQQPSAIARATALINPKYLVGVPNEKTVAEMYKYSAVAGIKKLGGFDTGTGMSVTQWISNSEQSFSEKASDLLGKGAEKADEVTWANIWAAVKRELNARIRSGKSELKPGSEEYYRAVADRFRDIIDYTQVYDSVLSKSQLMRSKSGLARMMTSFMAEPTLSYNLVVNSFKGDTINGGRAIAAFAANVVLNTLLQSLVAALRDKDDISYWERYIKNVTESLTGGKLPVAGSEFNVFGNLPLVKDAISVMQGYDVPRTDMSLVTAAFDVLKKLMKVTANRDKLSKDKSKKYKNMTLYQEKLFDVMWDAGVMITNFTPLPMQSVSREIKGVINNVSHWAGDAEHYKTTSYTLRDAIKEGAGFGEDNPLKAYNALKNKEDEVLRRLKQSDSWQTWVRKGLEKYDRGDDLDKKAINRIEKAATANYSGDYDTYERLVGAIEKEGFDRNDIIAAVESLVGDMRPKEEPDEPADKHLYTTKMLEDAIRQDKSEAVKDIKQKLKDVEGKTDDNIRSAVKKIARESYYEKGDEDGAIRVLRDYGDMSADEIKDTVDWFSYSVLNPDSELVYNSWQSWRSKASNGQVNNGRGKLTAAQYEAYTQAVKGITGDDLNGDGKTDSGTKKKKVLAAINKLPLTKDQKNTLYLVNGYGKDSIGEAPWN